MMPFRAGRGRRSATRATPASRATRAVAGAVLAELATGAILVAVPSVIGAPGSGWGGGSSGHHDRPAAAGRLSPAPAQFPEEAALPPGSPRSGAHSTPAGRQQSRTSPGQPAGVTAFASAGAPAAASTVRAGTGSVTGSPGGGTVPPTASGQASGGAATQPVTCQTDLPLSQAPDAGYAFLCQQGSTPLSWRSSQVEIYDRGLTAPQVAALNSALVQWQAVAKFQATFTTDRQAADVVFTSVPLDAGQPGYTEDGYTTVSYRCAPVCAYYHADVELSSTASLTQTDWLSTVLHELGHVAGLNHVSMAGEVMYPYLTMASPVVYSAGDRAGLAILAGERGA